jgi:transcriptional regulator with XRE-family HTH domain
VSQREIDARVSGVLERIRLLRISRNISIEDLADRANLSRSYIYYIETKKKVPTLTVLFRLSSALDVDVKDFFGM